MSDVASAPFTGEKFCWLLGLHAAQTDAIDNWRAVYPGRNVACVAASVIGVFQEFHAKRPCYTGKPGSRDGLGFIGSRAVTNRIKQASTATGISFISCWTGEFVPSSLVLWLQGFIISPVVKKTASIKNLTAMQSLFMWSLFCNTKASSLRHVFSCQSRPLPLLQLYS